MLTCHGLMRYDDHVDMSWLDDHLLTYPSNHIGKSFEGQNFTVICIFY